MQYHVSISDDGKTDISHLYNSNAVIERLTLSGTGKLDACMVSFGKHGESPSSQRDLLFLKPLHEQSEILLPHVKSFRASGYHFCYIHVFTGQVKQGDEIKLFLSDSTEA